MSIQVATKVTVREAEQIDKLIENGIALNRSDFIRQAIREFLEQHKGNLKVIEKKEEVLS